MTEEPAADRLLLLRHAHAARAAPGEKDHPRALDERGHAEAERLAQLLRERGVRIEHVICSTAERTRQTLQHLAGFFDPAAVEFSEALYADGADAYYDAARRAGSGSVLLVGHNPMIESTARSLASPMPGALGTGFPPCTLAIFRVPDGLARLSPGAAELEEAIIPPRA